MEICECMVRQDPLGQLVCKRCNGDVYACECPLRHFVTCPEHTAHTRSYSNEEVKEQLLAWHDPCNPTTVIVMRTIKEDK